MLGPVTCGQSALWNQHISASRHTARGMPSKVGTAFAAETLASEEPPSKASKYKRPIRRGRSRPRRGAQRPRRSSMEHKWFQLGLSAPRLGAGVSLVQALEVNCSPPGGEARRRLDKSTESLGQR